MNEDRKSHGVVWNAALELSLDLPGVGLVEVLAGLVIQLLEEIGDEVVQNADEQVPSTNLYHTLRQDTTKGLSMLLMSMRMPRMILE